MKNILSCKKTAIILLVITVISAVFYAHMLARPISYGMDYSNVTAYDGGTFEGKMKFYYDRNVINFNTNFNKESKSRYYYKDGYVFFTLAETDEDYAKEVAYINENFDEAITAPFYADKINSFQLVVSENDGFEMVYTCMPAIIFAIVGGVIELVLIALTAITFILRKKAKS